MSELFSIPGDPDFFAATPDDVFVIKTLGGKQCNGVTFTDDQLRALRRAYGFSDTHNQSVVEGMRQDHEVRVTAFEKTLLEALPYKREELERKRPKPFDAEGLTTFLESGDNVNLFRHAERDGLRIMGAISRFLEPGEDPVKLVLRLAVEAGYDVDVDPEWLEDFEDSEE